MHARDTWSCFTFCSNANLLTAPARTNSCRHVSQYTSRAAQLYKATLEKDVLRLATAPVSPTAAEAAKQGIDFLDSEVNASSKMNSFD